jgi:hypothetical protein
MNQPAKRKTDADATETNQFDVTGIFCGKLLRCPVRNRIQRPQVKETRTNTGLFALSTVKPHSGMTAMRGALRYFSNQETGMAAASQSGSDRIKTKGLMIC